MSEIDTSRELRFEQTGGQGYSVIFLAAISLPLGWWLASSPELFDGPTWLVRGAGVAGLALPFVMGLLWLRQRLRRGPAVVLGPTGVTFAPELVLVSVLPWKHVQRVFVTDEERFPRINFQLDDPEAVILAQPDERSREIASRKLHSDSDSDSGSGSDSDSGSGSDSDSDSGSDGHQVSLPVVCVRSDLDTLLTAISAYQTRYGPQQD